MNLSQCRFRYLRLIKNLGSYNGTPEASDISAALDDAMSRIAQECGFYYPAIPFALTADQAEYRFESSAFERRLVKPIRIYLNGSYLLDNFGRPGLWSVGDFERAYPDFMSADSGEPSLAVQYGGILRLHLPPSSSFVSSVSGYVAGEYIPGWIDSDGTYRAVATDAESAAVPDLPSQFHELIPELAAHLTTVGVADTDVKWGIVRARQGRVDQLLNRLRRYNRDSISATPYRLGTSRMWLS